MEKAMIEKISHKVSRQFPEMSGVQPSVRRSNQSSSDDDNYILTYKGTASLPGGHSMRRIVRVTADERGHVIRMSTSK
ncbi:MAG: hypothetical protein JXA97_08480 [Anaerolineales bacterium]|nr:hypothetical protein [Anaerolineales bacterium]